MILPVALPTRTPWPTFGRPFRAAMPSPAPPRDTFVRVHFGRQQPGSESLAQKLIALCWPPDGTSPSQETLRKGNPFKAYSAASAAEWLQTQGFIPADRENEFIGTAGNSYGTSRLKLYVHDAPPQEAHGRVKGPHVDLTLNGRRNWKYRLPLQNGRFLNPGEMSVERMLRQIRGPRHRKPNSVTKRNAPIG